MTTILPPETRQIQERLRRLGPAGVRKLSAQSGVPYSTIWKIRSGITTNPGMETVRKFVPALLRIGSKQ